MSLFSGNNHLTVMTSRSVITAHSRSAIVGLMELFDTHVVDMFAQNMIKIMGILFVGFDTLVINW